MRFCMVTTFYPPYHFGGDATYVRSLARALRRQGHGVTVIHCVDAYALREGYDDNSFEADLVTEDGIVIHRLQSQLRLLSPLVTQQTGRPGIKYEKLKTLLDQDFDVIHFHNISLIGGPAVLKMGDAPVKLYTLHEYWLLCPTHVFWKNGQQPCDRQQCLRCCVKSGIPPQWWRYTSLRHDCVTYVDALLTPSEYTAKRHYEAGFKGPMHVLPLFSTLNPGTPPSDQTSETLDSCHHRPYFLFVGRITAEKGIIPLLENFARLPQYDLLVAGDGALREELQQTYAHCSNIHFLGKTPQQQLIPLYQKATAVVVPSLMMETFGLIIVEAFACGTPVITRDAGGNVELIEKTGGGMIYHSDAELHRALHTLAQNPQVRQRLGQLAYKGYRAHYTEDIHIASYLTHIRAIQANKGISKFKGLKYPDYETQRHWQAIGRFIFRFLSIVGVWLGAKGQPQSASSD